MSTETAQVLDAPEQLQLVEASTGIRFLNYIVDLIVFYVICFVFGIVYAISGGDPEALDSILTNIVLILIYVLYYFAFESATGRTLGKYITGTKVVSEDGSAPTTKQILGRSFSRIVPFEPFSMFSGRGWHDSWSDTITIYTRPRKTS